MILVGYFVCQLPKGTFALYESRILLFVLMYPINLLEHSERIAAFVSESNTRIMPLGQHHTPE